MHKHIGLCEQIIVYIVVNPWSNKSMFWNVILSSYSSFSTVVALVQYKPSEHFPFKKGK